jgi:hypothetical protein
MQTSSSGTLPATSGGQHGLSLFTAANFLPFFLVTALFFLWGIPSSQQIDFTLIDPEWLRREVEARGFHLKHQETHNVPDSQFWAALFQRTDR